MAFPNVATSCKRAVCSPPAKGGGGDVGQVSNILGCRRVARATGSRRSLGVTLQLYDHGEAVGAAARVAPGRTSTTRAASPTAWALRHYVLDYEQRFKASVMQSFADSYAAGETPIPCVVCNQRSSLTSCWRPPASSRRTPSPTGHYIELRQGLAGAALHRARDSERDQSYFLFATTRAQLDWLSFPLGGYKKEEVRALARSFELPVAEKSDSQDICFVPRGATTQVIERLKPGGPYLAISCTSMGACSGGHGRYHQLHRRPTAWPGAWRAPLHSTSFRLDAATRQVVVGPRRELACRTGSPLER